MNHKSEAENSQKHWKTERNQEVLEERERVKEIEQLEKSGILNWDGSDTSRF